MRLFYLSAGFSREFKSKKQVKLPIAPHSDNSDIVRHRKDHLYSTIVLAENEP